MNHPSNAATISGPLLSLLQWLNGLYALGIAGLLAFSLVNPGFVVAALKIGADGPGSGGLVAGLLGVAVLGLTAAVLVHFFLGHLRAIVETVRSGDPFVAENARRLQSIAWLVLAGEILRLAIGGIAMLVTPLGKSLGIDIDIDVPISLAPWLAVLLLFVLAHVFADGARMRADLEGTV